MARKVDLTYCMAKDDPRGRGPLSQLTGPDVGGGSDGQGPKSEKNHMEARNFSSKASFSGSISGCQEVNLHFLQVGCEISNTLKQYPS